MLTSTLHCAPRSALHPEVWVAPGITGRKIRLPRVSTTRRPAMLILTSAFLAAGANGISMVAFPWLVLQRTGSAVDASVVAGAATLPLPFATLVAGTAVDSLGRRYVAMPRDAMSAVSVAAIPVLALVLGTDMLTTVVLAGLAALGAFSTCRDDGTSVDAS